MRSTPQWICWEPRPRPDGKVDKVPIDPATGRASDPHDPTLWTSHADAVATGRPVGFVFTEHDPFFFLDLDGCALPSGEWQPYVTTVTEQFPGAEIELSYSGRGLHVFGSYLGPAPTHGTRCSEIHAELYTQGRFVALGTNARGNARTDCTTPLRVLAARYFPPSHLSAGEWTVEPRDDWTGPTDDAELISKARASRSPFSDQCNFEELWTADADALAEHYPDSKGRPHNASSADAALARHLAFWTGCDCERIKRLMRESALARAKWEEREDWLDCTIAKMVKATTRVYDRPAPATDEVRTGYQFMPIDGQLELFKGCIYVVRHHRVCTADGQLLKPDQFNAVMPTYEFARSAEGKPTTRKPWEALIESMSMRCPIADDACFDPTSPWDGVIERDGMRYANTYRPVETARQAGDPSRFLLHVEKLLPVALDRTLLLSYMAAVIQHKGIKFQWAPLLQGVEGNGKTLFTRTLMHAIGRKHTHMPQAADISNKFNAWLFGTIFIGIEDIYIPSERRDVIEVLKPMITGGDGIGLQPKGVDQFMAEICCNFILNSNHRDALRKTRNDRRFAVFFTAQQERGDLERDGMGGGYFPSLYDWMRAEGYAIVHDYLAKYAIPDEINPALGHRAPDTSTTDEAIAASLGTVEQEIVNAVDEGRPGFAGGWISRTMLDVLLDAKRRTISINRQREILRELGYVPHPAVGRRTNNAVNPDGRRAELWVENGHPNASFGTAATAAQAYSKAQGAETGVSHG